ncbi:MAG: hypothetical protein IPF68_19750 [Bacteroidales bacterium]|nr:hypothetical protein [Bacteroidales bacterium]
MAQLDNLTFTPSGNWYGTTTFDYNATDGANWAAADAQVIITITSENDAPVAVDDIVSTPEDTRLVVQLHSTIPILKVTASL